MTGIANGAAPRLRLPLPKEFSPDLLRWMEDHAGPQNRQYLYLGLQPGQLAPHGENLPVSTIILLDRSDEGAPRLEPVTSSEVMRRLIYQNFSRSMNPARVLAMLSGLVETAECLRLQYSNSEEAAAFLKAWCDAHPRDAAARIDPSTLPPDSLAVLTTDTEALGDQTYQRNPSVCEVRHGEDVFVACAEGPGMHAFNGVTTGIWTLLAEPTTHGEITQTLAAAFPEQPVKDLTEAVMKIMQAMLKHRLIMSV
ncbi:MAG: PqqD family protein [Rhodobacteraceae bacterium]|nr:PqqD family protein [Paracoccaceae bacterium]